MASPNIFGQDARVAVVNPAQQAYRMVGRLKSAIAGQIEDCSASLVGPDIVLTNLHCVESIVASADQPSTVVFYASYNQGKSLAQSSVTQIISSHKTTTEVVNGVSRTKITYDSNKGDWALLILEEPIGDQVINPATGEKLGWFSVVAHTSDLQKKQAVDPEVQSLGLAQTNLFSPIAVSMSGYSGDIKASEVMWTQAKCSIKAVNSFDQVLHTCNNTPGSSGSPIYVINDQGPEIAALNSGFLTGKQNLSAGTWLNVERYTPEYANVAVDTQNFYPALQLQLKKFTARQAQRQTP